MQRKTPVNTILKVIVRELHDTKTRVSQLERRNRWLAGLSAISCLSVVILIAIVFSPYKTITAKQYVITDDQGAYRLIFGPSAITFLDSKLVMRARLGMGLEGSPSLAFFDEKEKMRTSMGPIDQGMPRISFFDENENCRSFLGLNQEGRMIITLYDTEGNLIETFGLYPQNWIDSLEAKAIGDVSPSVEMEHP